MGKGVAPLKFESEAALCSAFIRSVPQEWIVYPETAGWDILLVHRAGGWQIGVEAKLTLNAKVLCQAIRGLRNGGATGPDFRAVLVGRVVAENAVLANALGLTVIKPMHPDRWRWPRRSLYWDPRPGPPLVTFGPDLPEVTMPKKPGTYVGWNRAPDWHDLAPEARHSLPDYVPDVAAGVPAPMVLSNWKIAAMRVCVWVERRGVITRAVFRDLHIDPSRWMTGHWLRPGERRGEWVAGPIFPADKFRREHPTIYPQVEADFAVWAKEVKGYGAAVA